MRKPEHVKKMKIESVDVMINIARDPRFEKVKTVFGHALKMMSKVPEYESRIKSKGGSDLMSV